MAEVAVTLLLLVVLVALPRGVLVDQVVAVVDKEVVSHSELLSEARIALALREGEAAAIGELSPEFLQSFRDYLVGQLLIAGQARRLGAALVSDEDVEGERERLARRFGSVEAYRAFLRRFDISAERLLTALRRNLVNERHIAARMRIRLGQGAIAGDARGEKRYQEELTRWIRELREGVEIRLLSDSGELELQ